MQTTWRIKDTRKSSSRKTLKNILMNFNPNLKLEILQVKGWNAFFPVAQQSMNPHRRAITKQDLCSTAMIGLKRWRVVMKKISTRWWDWLLVVVSMTQYQTSLNAVMILSVNILSSKHSIFIQRAKVKLLMVKNHYGNNSTNTFTAIKVRMLKDSTKRW